MSKSLYDSDNSQSVVSHASIVASHQSKLEPAYMNPENFDAMMHELSSVPKYQRTDDIRTTDEKIWYGGMRIKYPCHDLYLDSDDVKPILKKYGFEHIEENSQDYNVMYRPEDGYPDENDLVYTSIHRDSNASIDRDYHYKFLPYGTKGNKDTAQNCIESYIDSDGFVSESALFKKIEEFTGYNTFKYAQTPYDKTVNEVAQYRTVDNDKINEILGHAEYRWHDSVCRLGDIRYKNTPDNPTHEAHALVPCTGESYPRDAAIYAENQAKIQMTMHTADNLDNSYSDNHYQLD